MKIENKRQWVGELFFLLGTILYITYYFFYIAYYWYVEKDPTRQIPVQRLFYIGSMERSDYWSSRSCFDVFMLEKLWRN